jgi:hypothetical protein
MPHAGGGRGRRDMKSLVLWFLGVPVSAIIILNMVGGL